MHDDYETLREKEIEYKEKRIEKNRRLDTLKYALKYVSITETDENEESPTPGEVVQIAETFKNFVDDIENG